ncbi:MAG: malto-oligosyltrehalose synthase [Simkaniaceae bacterium]|nr:malto-oligosyltrehalose synthase [Candidatus Sacchlamyda saccharinae]
MKKAPSSIYRIQLNQDFSLKQAIKLLPYLKELGVEGVYCSPYFAAFSPHGYDIIDPNRINPQIATKKEFITFCKELKKLGLFHIADIVPNHMGIRGDNLWWQDVLKKGEKSKYAKFFDVDWSKEKILLPFLEEAKNLSLPVSKHYKLVSWLHAGKETSYRRFFNIGDLIGIRIEDPQVLEAHHKWVFQLLKEKKIDGLRVDHPDGLYDPQQYFDRLRRKTKKLIIVEKILGWEEELPSNWQVDGTVGYEFLNMLTGIFVENSPKLTQTYSKFIGRELDFNQLLYKNKKFYMATEMAGDINFLAKKLNSDLPLIDIEKGLSELLAGFPVYRSYIGRDGKLPPRDKPYWEKAFKAARKHISPNVYRLLKDVVFKNGEPIDFILRFQQLSAPIMAKGFEDITLYQYNRLICNNEVGSEPERGGVSVEEFHNFCKQKQEKYPLGFLAASTHDTKRSLDVRMQIACLSEMPKAWENKVEEWAKLNKKYKCDHFPDPNAEYALYQNLLGAWPGKPTFERLWTVFQKSVREARTHTSWREPNRAYEKACKHFLKSILKKGSPFLQSFAIFQKEIQEKGEWKSLSATALQLGCPGIIDLYQGCENFNFLLVDPDNRSPVDYTAPKSLKNELTQAVLHFRKKHKALFLEGGYIPLKTDNQTIAFLRRYKDQVLLVAAPLRHFHFKPYTITLPKNYGEGQSLFSHDTYTGKALNTSKLFQEAPFAWVFWPGTK